MPWHEIRDHGNQGTAVSIRVIFLLPVQTAERNVLFGLHLQSRAQRYS